VEFLLLIWASPTDQLGGDDAMREYYELDAALEASGELIRAAPFQGPDVTSAVRVRDGATSITPGPAQPTEEWLAGYYLVSCASEERAREIAATIPDARTGTVEVKPVLDLPDEFEPGL
jgi:hypothetical protein